MGELENPKKNELPISVVMGRVHRRVGGRWLGMRDGCVGVARTFILYPCISIKNFDMADMPNWFKSCFIISLCRF